MKNINYLDHPYWIPKCLNVGRISIPLQIFSYIYFPQIFTEIGWMFENVKIPIDHHAIFLFWLFQNLLILSHLSESFDVPAGCSVSSHRSDDDLQYQTCWQCSSSNHHTVSTGIYYFSRMPELDTILVFTQNNISKMLLHKTYAGR